MSPDDGRSPWWWRFYKSVFRSGEPSDQPLLPPQTEPEQDPCCREASPQQDRRIARRAMEEGDLEHAAHHVAGAVFDDPNCSETTRLIDELIAAAEDPLALVPLGERVYAGTAALRAYILAQRGRMLEAMDLLLQVMNADRNRGFWRWGLQWAQQPGVAERLRPAQGAALLAAVVGQFTSTIANEPEARAELEQAAAAGKALLEAFPQDASIKAMQSCIVRRLGQADEALQLAEEADAIQPSYATAAARAMAHSMQGHTDAAMAAYQDALKFDPKDADARTDIALLLLNAGRIAEARKWAEEAVQFESRHRTAEPLHFYLLALTETDQRWQRKLAAYVEMHPDHMAEMWLRSLQAFIGYVPEPGEATINVLRQVLEHAEGLPAGGCLSLKLSALEAPSSRLTADLALAPHGVRLQVTVESIPEPDPRVPIGPVHYTLWQYDGAEPAPAMPAPAPMVEKHISALARQHFDVDGWFERAGLIAEELGTPAVESLLGAMVHPSQPPAGVPAWVWIQRLQIAAAMIIARIDGGWEGSVRQKAMISLVRGPVDWTTSAALLALAQLAREEPDLSESIYRMFHERMLATPTTGYCCYSYALACNALRLPRLAPAMRDEYERLRRCIEAGE